MDLTDTRALLDFYRSFLLDDIIPFWLKHGIDRECGGIASCMKDDGTIISYDKYTWSQARGLWVFAALYNRIKKNKQFIETATAVKDFLLNIKRDNSGDWPFYTDRKGNIKEGATSIYADCFVVYGLSELYRALNNGTVKDTMLSTFKRIEERINDPDFDAVAPYQKPKEWKIHAVPMMLLEVTQELAETLNDDKLRAKAQQYMRTIMDYFVIPDKQVLLENLDSDYSILDHPDKGIMNPGHTIESMWFVLHQAQRLENEDIIERASEVIRWALEKGWDEKHGGLFHGIDAFGQKPTMLHWDKKLWWPHTEALYALILAHHLTGKEWCREWYRKIHEYSFNTFPVTEHGEWTQRLNRNGSPIADVVALPVKDPFHLPRAVILMIQCLERNLATE